MRKYLKRPFYLLVTVLAFISLPVWAMKVERLDCGLLLAPDPQTFQTRTPELVFVDGTSLDAIQDELQQRGLQTKNVVVVSDPFNSATLSGFSNLMVVHNNQTSALMEHMAAADFSNSRVVIGVGGCTSMDMAKVLATHLQLPYVGVPTLASTACLSVNRAVVRDGGTNKLVLTQVPDKTLVSLRTLTSGGDVGRWASSGLADFLANVSTAIDMAWREDLLSTFRIKAIQPRGVGVLLEFQSNFSMFDQKTLKRLVSIIHEEDLDTIRGGFEFERTAGEHQLYNRLLEAYPQHRRPGPTHGLIVGIGTLLAARIFGELTRDLWLYDHLYQVLGKIGAPVTWASITATSLTRSQIEATLRTLSPKNFLGAYFHQRSDMGILDRTFPR